MPRACACTHAQAFPLARSLARMDVRAETRTTRQAYFTRDSLVPSGRRSICSTVSGHADGERRGRDTKRRVASERSRRDTSVSTFRSRWAVGGSPLACAESSEKRGDIFLATFGACHSAHGCGKCRLTRLHTVSARLTLDPTCRPNTRTGQHYLFQHSFTTSPPPRRRDMTASCANGP